MHLRQQALIVLVAACCCAGGGCARLLAPFLAPQQAAMSAANQVANRATGSLQSDLSSMDREVSRLLDGKGGSRDELKRIQQELDRRNPANRPREGSAQDDPERLRPWHPRVAKPSADAERKASVDVLMLAKRTPERALPASGPLPDGVPGAELRGPVDRTKIRVEPPR